MLTGNKMTEQVATLPLKEFVFLDFSAIQNFKDLQVQFVNAAQSLMSEHDLMHANNRWQITAIELYLFTESEMWRDVYTHQNPVQLESGTWYVHQRGTHAPNWRAPNWSGLDITCGSRPSTFGGLLVRQLCKKKGSATATKAILRGGFYPRIYSDRWSSQEKAIIENIHGKGIYAGSDLTLVSCPKRTEPIWIGPRIGLRKRDPDPTNPEGISFRNAPLRVATWKMDGQMKEWNG
jgi:hypothetical protein